MKIRIASKYVEAAGDIQTLYYADSWINQFVNAYISSAEDRHTARILAKEVKMYLSPTGAEVILSIPEGFPEPDTSALTGRFTNVRVERDIVRPSGWHISHPVVRD